MKISEAEAEVLDRLVAQCEGQIYHGPAWTKYSTDWAQGGPIIERERIAVWGDNDIYWEAECGWNWAKGQTPLVAAMRAYVANKLGDEVEIPDELMEQEV